MRSPNQHSFAQLPAVSIPRSVFPRNRAYKTTLDVGKLYPVYIDDVLPGDTYNVTLTAFMRLMTLITSPMDNLVADFFFFFVPNRIDWENWQHFCGERDNPVADYNNDTAYLVPQITPPAGQGFANGSLADYFGLPTGVPGISVDAMPFRAYNLIWNEFFRDENLMPAATVDIGDTTVDDTNYQILRTCQRPTYFNTALPWPQKGPNVELPLGTTAPVIGTGPLGLEGFNGSSALGDHFELYTSGTSPYPLTLVGSTAGRTYGVDSDSTKSNVLADLSHATAATINTIREAFQVQRWYERLAQSGSRYIELLQGMFGVTSPDARLQRPEYLGGGHIPVQIHTVTQTSASDLGNSSLGELAGNGVAGGSVGFSKSFVEHGWILGLVRIRADVTYQYGIDRMFSRKTKFDYYWPPFAHLGEQEILNKEIYAQGSSVVDQSGNVVDDQVFGYQERWAEYRYGVSHVTGQLRSNYAQSLDYWHLAYKYANLPTLSSTFVEENPPIGRVIAAPYRPAFLYDSLITCNCVRPMPTYSVPGLVDHF